MSPAKLTGFALSLMLLSSCKKDTLVWQQAEKLETSASVDRLNSIYFVNDSTGFVVGGERFTKATILSTRNGGKTWKYDSYPEAGKSIFGITMSPSGYLYTAGYDGKILRSADTGKSWIFYQSWYLPYKDIYFPTQNRGFIIAGISYRTGFRNTMDAGGNVQPYDSIGYELNDIEMVNPKTGFISGFGIILKTIDSGQTWSEQNIRNDNFSAIHALSDNSVWTCGYNGSIYHSGNGGTDWNRLRNGNDLALPRYRLLDIAFKNEKEGYACGEDGLVIYTDDGGHHWMEFDRFTDAALRSIWMLKDGSLLVCGDKGSLYRLRRG